MPLGQPASGPEIPPAAEDTPSPEPEQAIPAAPAAAAPAPSRKVKVRVTMFPDPIDVDPGEIPALRGQGLLIEDTTATPEGTTP